MERETGKFGDFLDTILASVPQGPLMCPIDGLSMPHSSYFLGKAK